MNGFEMHGLGHLSASSLNVASSDPFKIEGPALISFSGGRTSGYMLWRILQAHGGTLPDEVHVAFQNTGKEMPQTLDFIRDCGERWGVEIAWLEFKLAEHVVDRWQRVNYETAARDGKPFSDLLSIRKMLPNPTMRFCTADLKIKVMGAYGRSLGWDEWDNVVGLRADEPARVARMRGATRDRWSNLMPLAAAGTTKADVTEFWSRQNFDLMLPNINGKTALGNCDLCFLKSAATISAIIRANPESANWWIAQEATPRPSKGGGATFRSDRPSYAEMAKAVREQRTFDFGTRDEIIDCFCGDAA